MTVTRPSGAPVDWRAVADQWVRKKGFVVLDEHLSLTMLPGFVLVALGVWLGTQRSAVS